MEGMTPNLEINVTPKSVEKFVGVFGEALVNLAVEAVVTAVRKDFYERFDYYVNDAWYETSGGTHLYQGLVDTGTYRDSLEWKMLERTPSSARFIIGSTDKKARKIEYGQTPAELARSITKARIKKWLSGKEGIGNLEIAATNVYRSIRQNGIPAKPAFRRTLTSVKRRKATMQRRFRKEMKVIHGKGKWKEL